eukprot:COSAG06_NODE_43006_length_376_cov_0.794224_1_plen_53_part_01
MAGVGTSWGGRVTQGAGENIIRVFIAIAAAAGQTNARNGAGLQRASDTIGTTT